MHIKCYAIVSIKYINNNNNNSNSTNLFILNGSFQYSLTN